MVLLLKALLVVAMSLGLSSLSIAKSRTKPKKEIKAVVRKNTPPRATTKKVAAKPIKSTDRVNNTTLQFNSIKRNYRQAEAGNPQLWASLQTIEQKIEDLSPTDQASLLQIEASILQRNGYVYLSAMYAAEAIKRSANSLTNPALKPAWTLLQTASNKRPMQGYMEQFAAGFAPSDSAPAFANSWNYYRGNAAQSAGQANAALDAFGKVRINDTHYLSAKYQIAMIHLANDRLDEAEKALKAMLNGVSQTLAPLPESTLVDLSNYAKLALARLYYQGGKFVNAIKFYRSVDRDSNLFYDALFEQSWAFFMAGYPNHALGAIHSIESPFFKDVFNPEASVLRAISFYWMCRYDDAKGALADFNKKHGDSVEALGDFLNKKRLSDETAYQLFENFVSGVSSQSLGIPKPVLESAAEAESMMLLREQYAGLVAESQRFSTQGILSVRRNNAAQQKLDKQLAILRKKIGAQYIVELQSLKKHFDRLFEQSQFLYVELLMSEKEQLMGRELHASSKMDRVTRRKNIAGWGEKTQGWGDNRLNEFWWDEVGFYIYDAKPMCKTSSAP